MFHKACKGIAMLVIALVLLSHHSLQAYALGIPHHHSQECASHDCHHETKIEVCEKIQSDQMKVSQDFFVLPEQSGTLFDRKSESGLTPSEVFERYRERVPISYSQLPRSWL